MNQKEKDNLYIGIAKLYANNSKAKKIKVGAVLVTNQEVVIGGINGTPSGISNECEYLTNYPENLANLVTRPEVIHAEKNAILRCAREGISVLGSTLYTSLSPCVQCSAMLIQAGVKRVVYAETYKDVTGLDLLKSSGIIVEPYQ